MAEQCPRVQDFHFEGHGQKKLEQRYTQLGNTGRKRYNFDSIWQ